MSQAHATLDDLRHELRTPLNHIVGYGEMLLEDVEGGPRSGLASHLRGIVVDARLLLERIKEFGTATDIEVATARMREAAPELAPPLSAILGATHALAALLTQDEDQTMRRDVERISAAAERLRGLLGLEAPATSAPGGLAAQPGASRAEAAVERGGILVVDDNENNRDVLSRRLAREGYSRVTMARDGREALDLLASQPFDLVLLDIMMPGLDGYQVLESMKGDARLRDIPVIMISALDEMKSVIRCIELGAEDYLAKPFDPTLLRARVGACLEKKRLRDEIHEWNRTLEARVQEQVAQLDRLGRLKGFFSPQVAEAIVDGGGDAVLKTHRREVVVVFLDLRGFTAFTDKSEPEEVMAVLGDYHRAMGRVVLAHGGTLERFIGDGIMIVFNDPITVDNPAGRAIRMALETQEKFAQLRQAWSKRHHNLDLGVGIAQGDATLGAIGFEGRWDYACIGSVANLASRLCNEAKGGQVLVNAKTLSRAGGRIRAEPVGELALKGISQPVTTYNITGMEG